MLDVILASTIGTILFFALRNRLRTLRKGQCGCCEGNCKNCTEDGRKRPTG